MAVSTVTHPLLWFVWPRVAGGDYLTYVVTGEALVVLLEWLLFAALARPVGLRRAFVLALVANAASCGIGLLIPLRAWFG